MPAPRVAAIVPAYCEGRLIAKTISTIPSWVREVIVIDDGSTDDTSDQVLALSDPRLKLVSHPKNRGVGAAIYSGYQIALRGEADVFVVLAGDNQMDPSDLSSLIAPLVEGRADYAKGNRLIHERARDMPWSRRWGTRLLARLTSWVAGHPISDSQCGYTAISRATVRETCLDDLWSGYGYPNELLIRLIASGLRVAEVPVRPVYQSEKSGLRPYHLLSIIALILRRGYLEKRSQKLRLRSPHPLPVSAGGSHQ